jgi:hypothetical protein
MTRFDHETDLYVEEYEGQTMPRTRVIRLNDLIVQAYQSRYGIPDHMPALAGHPACDADRQHHAARES